MSRLASLLGSSTRANILEALARAKRPLTSYRVSKMYNMNVAKVYIEMKKLVGLGFVGAREGKMGQREYYLFDRNLRTLASELSSNVISFDEWRSPDAKRRRFRDAMIKIPKFSSAKRNTKRNSSTKFLKPSRMPGELDTLALLAGKRFDRKYRKIGERVYDARI